MDVDGVGSFAGRKRLRDGGGGAVGKVSPSFAYDESQNKYGVNCFGRMPSPSPSWRLKWMLRRCATSRKGICKET